MRQVFHAICTVAIVLAADSSLLSAQAKSGTEKKRIPVSVVLTSAFPYSGDVVILRRPESVPSDLIVMRRENATPELFSEAVRDLQTIRRVGGDMPQVGALLRSRPNTSKARKKPLPWSERVLADVRNKPVETFGGIANAQVVQIWLPPTKKAK
jgi:hypothetical protein